MNLSTHFTPIPPSPSRSLRAQTLLMKKLLIHFGKTALLIGCCALTSLRHPVTSPKAPQPSPIPSPAKSEFDLRALFHFNAATDATGNSSATSNETGFARILSSPRRIGLPRMPLRNESGTTLSLPPSGKATSALRASDISVWKNSGVCPVNKPELMNAVAAATAPAFCREVGRMTEQTGRSARTTNFARLGHDQVVLLRFVAIEGLHVRERNARDSDRRRVARLVVPDRKVDYFRAANAGDNRDHLEARHSWQRIDA